MDESHFIEQIIPLLPTLMRTAAAMADIADDEDEVVYVTTNENQGSALYAINATDRSLSWKYQVTTEFTINPTSPKTCLGLLLIFP
jgi:outer membrane protein assembly factor BamB